MVSPSPAVTNVDATSAAAAAAAAGAAANADADAAPAPPNVAAASHAVQLTAQSKSRRRGAFSTTSPSPPDAATATTSAAAPAAKADADADVQAVTVASSASQSTGTKPAVTLSSITIPPLVRAKQRSLVRGMRSAVASRKRANDVQVREESCASLGYFLGENRETLISRPRAARVAPEVVGIKCRSTNAPAVVCNRLDEGPIGETLAVAHASQRKYLQQYLALLGFYETLGYLRVIAVDIPQVAQMSPKLRKTALGEIDVYVEALSWN